MSNGDRGPRDRGFATVWVITAMALVVVAAGAAICYGATAVARHRAAAAADAVALDVALRAVDGVAAACAGAAGLARLNGAAITRCQLDGAVTQIEVTAVLPGPLAAFGPAVGRASAGPVSEAPP